MNNKLWKKHTAKLTFIGTQEADTMKWVRKTEYTKIIKPPMCKPHWTLQAAKYIPQRQASWQWFTSK